MTLPSGLLPTFIVIGAAKGGTTSLWRYLKAHPEVFMCSPKEPEFFLGGKRWRRGVDWYASLFEKAGEAKARGEASVTYSYFPLHKWVPKRMREIVPDVKLVYVLRNPLERIVSMYRFRVDLGSETRGIDDAVLDRIYIEPSKYVMQIEQYLAHFDRSQLLVITSDDLAASRGATLGSVFEFIGVDPAFSPPSAAKEYNTASDHRKGYGFVPRMRDTKLHWWIRRLMPSDSKINQLAWRLASRRSATADPAVKPSEETRSRILEAIRPDLARLPEYLGRDFRCWDLLAEPAHAPDA